MKKLYFLVLTILFVSCNSFQETPFDCLLGNSERTNDPKGNKTIHEFELNMYNQKLAA